MMLHHHPAVAIVAVAAAFVLPYLTPASRIGLAVVAAVLCAGLPLVAELGVIFGATLITAALNRAREVRHIEIERQQRRQAENAVNEIDRHIAARQARRAVGD